MQTEYRVACNFKPCPATIPVDEIKTNPGWIRIVIERAGIKGVWYFCGQPCTIKGMVFAISNLRQI